MDSVKYYRTVAVKWLLKVKVKWLLKATKYLATRTKAELDVVVLLLAPTRDFDIFRKCLLTAGPNTSDCLL